MSLFLTFRAASGSLRSKTSSQSRTNRMRRRRWQLEPLESRTLLAYAFIYGGPNGPQSVIETGGSDSLAIVNNGFGLLEWSENGGAFSTQWGVLPTDTLNASPTTDVSVFLNGDDSAIELGNPTSSASANLAQFSLVAAPGNMTDSLSIDDSDSPLGAGTYTVNGSSGAITGPLSDINVLLGPTAFGGGVTIDGSAADNTFDILSTYSSVNIPEPVTVVGGSGTNVVNVGSDPGTPASSTLSGIVSQVTVSDPSGLMALNVLDAGDTTSGDAVVGSASVSGLGFGLNGSVSYAGGLIGGVTNLVIDGGTNGGSGITYLVAGTSADTTLNTGPNDDTVGVENTSADAPLTIHGNGGADTVDITQLGSVAGILGAITIDNAFGFTAVNIDASADATAHDATLAGNDPSTITGVAPATITYTTSDVSSLTMTLGNAGLDSNNLTVDFSTGNPIPLLDTPGLIYDAGAGAANTLNLQGSLPNGLGGPGFASEVHTAGGPFFGTIAFTDQNSVGSGLSYTGLTPINDTTPATDYTFNDGVAGDQSFNAGDGPLIGGFQTLQFSSGALTPLFETTDVANKTNVTFSTTTSNGVNGIVDILTAATGLAALTFNTDTNGDNQVDFFNTPPGVDTTLNGGTDEDTTNVTGMGLPLGTILLLNGGPGQDTLNYNAGGLNPTVIRGGLAGEVSIVIPGFGRVDATSYENVNITNVGPLVITPGPARTINTVEGFNLTDAIVGTFTMSTTPPHMPDPPGLPASDFLASIDWGDPSPDPEAGTITQDASDPSIYYITATHTFPQNGTFTVANTIVFSGGTLISTVNGVMVSFTYDASGPIAGNSATANVIQGTLAVSAFPIVGTEGIAIPAAPIATFIDAGGADPVANYSATISITGPSGFSLMIPAGAITITQNGNAAQYTVGAPAITLPEEGTYQVVVSVTDTDLATPITVAGASLAVIADATLTPGAVVLTPASPHTGVPFSLAGSFTDADTTTSSAADFSAVIDWGDGSPNSLGTVVGAGGAYTVDGAHTYAKPSGLLPYAITIVVTDNGGSKVTLSGTATVTDLAVTGSTNSFTAVEGQNTGLFVLATFTDPNTLATLSDVSATLAVGGWGDGMPAIAGITLVVQQIGGSAAGPVFEVLGDHTYAEETPAGLPDTLSVIITTLGGASTTLTSPPGGGVTVLDARLTSSNGTELTGIEGSPVPPTAPSVVGPLLGTFTDANQAATSADFTIAPGSVVVNWGDGSALETLTAANLTANGTPNGVIFSINAPHTYSEEGTYAYTVTVTDDGGSVTMLSGSAIIADAKLSFPSQTAINTTEAALFPVPVFDPPVFSSFRAPFTPVATFTDANPTAPISDFTATIDWGDGTPPTAGTIEPPLLGGTAFRVFGTHTYADSGVNGGTGVYPIQVFIVDVGGSKLTVPNQANVADRAIVLTGQLNPASDSGVSNTDDITNVKQPDFYGSSEPFSHVSLFATPVGGGLALPIGQVQAGSDGSWNIVSVVPLADNSYVIMATAIDQFGVTTTVSPAVITPHLVIDTVGPVITNLVWNRLNGQVDYQIQDPSPASGVNLATLLDSSNYLFTKVHAQKAYPGKWIVTNIDVNPGSAVNSYDVDVTFNHGATIRGGYYLFTIRDSSNGSSSVQDIAGNHLDGVFYGAFPSGNGLAGSDFVTMLSGYHDKIFAPQTIAGTSSAANGGIGGPRIGSVHSGVFSPVIPPGQSPVLARGRHAVKGQSLVKVQLHGGTRVDGFVHHPKVVVGHHPRGPLQK